MVAGGPPHFTASAPSPPPPVSRRPSWRGMSRPERHARWSLLGSTCSPAASTSTSAGSAAWKACGAATTVRTMTTSWSRRGGFVVVTDFYSPVDGSWRTAIINAMAHLGSIGGGTLYFPARSSSYDVDNTGLGAISWDHDGIWWVGASPTASVITNTSTDGADLIRFNGGITSIQRCGWRNLRFVGGSTAGTFGASPSRASRSAGSRTSGFSRRRVP